MGRLCGYVQIRIAGPWRKERQKKNVNYVVSLLKELIGKRRLVLDLAKADFKKRFVGSYFGIVWMFVQPIVTVLIYWLIFGPIGFKSAPPVPNASYIEWLIPRHRAMVLFFRGIKLRDRLSPGI